MTMQTLKQALIAVCVGVAITFVTEAAQVLVAWLHTLNAEAIGSSVGSAAYLAQKIRQWV